MKFPEFPILFRNTQQNFVTKLVDNATTVTSNIYKQLNSSHACAKIWASFEHSTV